LLPSILDAVFFDDRLDSGILIGRQHRGHKLLAGYADTRDAPTLVTLTGRLSKAQLNSEPPAPMELNERPDGVAPRQTELPRVTAAGLMKDR
jgi:hypothetical protein